jgi:hypothetical protein
MRFALLVLIVCFAQPATSQEIPGSVARRSGFTRTATEAEVDQILAATADADPRIERWTMGTSNERRPIQALKIGFTDSSENPPADPNAATDPRPLTVIIIGGIHSGECAGKEALFDITREIATHQHDDWFENLRLIVVPSLSPDSNMRRGVDNRPGQVGPSEGMGVRPNAQGLDLNRDFIKLESPEIRSLVSAMNQFDADVLIDLHTTNGSQHRYDLTYDPPHHPLTPVSIRRFLREGLLPTVTLEADQQGFPFFYYGNFDRGHTRWTTYGYEGRYSTNYMGLRGKIGLLSEAYSYASYPRRIEASGLFVAEVLDYLHSHAEKTRSVLANSMPPQPGDPLGLTARLEAFADPVKVRGYAPDPAADGQERSEFDYPVAFYGNFVADTTSLLPAGYFVPAGYPRVIQLLDHHGIQHQQVTAKSDVEGEQYTISALDVEEREFQGHKMVALAGEWNPVQLQSGQTGHWVSADQPLIALAASILQPESVDSIATWNVIPADELQPGNTFPVYRFPAVGGNPFSDAKD